MHKQHNPLHAYIGAMFMDGLSHAQIAALLGLSTTRVRQLLLAEGITKDVRGRNTLDFWISHLRDIKEDVAQHREIPTSPCASVADDARVWGDVPAPLCSFAGQTQKRKESRK